MKYMILGAEMHQTLMTTLRWRYVWIQNALVNPECQTYVPAQHFSALKTRLWGVYSCSSCAVSVLYSIKCNVNVCPTARLLNILIWFSDTVSFFSVYIHVCWWSWQTLQVIKKCCFHSWLCISKLLNSFYLLKRRWQQRIYLVSCLLSSFDPVIALGNLAIN